MGLENNIMELHSDFSNEKLQQQTNKDDNRRSSSECSSSDHDCVPNDNHDLPVKNTSNDEKTCRPTGVSSVSALHRRSHSDSPIRSERAEDGESDSSDHTSHNLSVRQVRVGRDQISPSRRIQSCPGCAELRRVRREVKRLEQELREAYNSRYAEEQRSLNLLEQVDTKSREAVELRQKMLHRSNSTFFEGWFNVCLGEATATRRLKSRGFSWQNLYVVVRGGQMLLYNVSQQRRTSLTMPILTMDINSRMSVGNVKETDPVIIATNKDNRKMFKIEYIEQSQKRNSVNKRSSTCEVSFELTTKKTILIDAPTIEERDQWMRMLSEEVTVAGVWYKKTANSAVENEKKMRDFSCQADTITCTNENHTITSQSHKSLVFLSTVVIITATVATCGWFQALVLSLFTN